MQKWEENKKKYNLEYKKTKMKRVPLDMQLKDFEEMKSHADQRGETVNGFIKRAILETMQRDGETS